MFVIAEMVSQIPITEWEALVFKAKEEAAITSTGMISQVAITLLEEYCEVDHIQTLKTISDNHCPKEMTIPVIPQKFRMSLLMLHKLGNALFYILGRNNSIFSMHKSRSNYFIITHFSVETKKFILKRNFEKEHLEREAAEKGCVEAMAQMESFNKADPIADPISKDEILVWEFQFLSIRNFLMIQMTKHVHHMN